MGTFGARISELQAKVGTGNLIGKVTVDQIYAQNQHESVWFKHPAGGKPKYLSDPLFGNAARYMRHLSRNVLEGSLGRAMATNMENLSGHVFREAPWEFADLRASGHPEVHDNGVVVYDRPPNIHRLTQAELDAKDDLRALGLGHNR